MDNEKPKVIIIDTHIESEIKPALRIAEEIMLAKTADVIIVNDLNKTEVDINSLPKQNPFANPPLIIKNYRLEEPDTTFFKGEENNPWPPPKGRRGKKRY